MKCTIKWLTVLPIIFLMLLCTSSISTVYADSYGLYKEGYYYYYQNKNGDVITNKFVKFGDKYRYFDDDGRMAVNTLEEINGKYYSFDENGYRRTGWHDLEFYFNEAYSGRHYFRSDGTMVYDCFLKSGEHQYGFDIHGVQYIDRFGMINGKVYKFDKNGYKVSYKLSTIDSVEKFMNEGYEWLSLPSGECQLEWNVLKGDKENNPYDYKIYASVSPDKLGTKYYKTKSVMSDLIYEMGKLKYTDADREKANKTLQKYITTAAKQILKVKPSAKVEAYFYESWHTYSETWRIYSNDFHSQMWMTCRNYEEDYNRSYRSDYDAYKETKQGKLHWVATSTPCTKHSY